MAQSRTERKKEALATRALEFVQERDLAGKKLTPQVLQTLGTRLRMALDLPERMEGPLRSSLVPKLGQRLSGGLLKQICRQVAFGRDKLMEGEPLNLSSYRGGAEVGRVRTVKLGRNPSMVVELLTGHLAGRFVEKEISQPFVQWLGNIGGLRGRTSRTFHPRELVGLELQILIKKSEGRLKAEDFNVTDDQKRRNAAYRLERQKANCRQACFLCPNGLDRCDKATHPETWKIKECRNGHTAYHEGDRCVHCAQKEYKKDEHIFEFEEVAKR